LFVGFTVALTGCPWGQKYPYHLAQPFVEQGRAMSIALAVVDQRVSVNAGGRPDFVGVARDGYGKTYDIATESGQPLAADFTVSIRRGLEAAGYRVTPVRVPDRSRPEIVVRQLAQTGAERLLAVRIATWASDGYHRGELYYDVTMRALDGGGRELGRAVVSGRDVMGPGFVVKVPRLYLQKLEQLLNDPAIKRGLAPSAPGPIAPAMPVAPAPDQPPPPATEPSVVVPAP
jgi:hypothetical protein